jgi:hypothetical protein
MLQEVFNRQPSADWGTWENYLGQLSQFETRIGEAEIRSVGKTKYVIFNHILYVHDKELETKKDLQYVMLYFTNLSHRHQLAKYLSPSLANQYFMSEIYDPGY